MGLGSPGFRLALRGHRGDMPDRDEAVITAADDKDDLATDAVLTVNSRDELVYLLGQACEIEHGTAAELDALARTA